MKEPELKIYDFYLSNSHELFDCLLSKISWDNRMQARKTASFGSPYNYSNISYESSQMLNELVPIVDKLEQDFGFSPNNCLINYYPTGDSMMGFHSDLTDILVHNTGISIISLGAERIITFQNKQDKTNEHSYLLKSGSLFFMPQKTQKYWKHGIMKQTETFGRISLTFRSLKSHNTD